jgi:alpha,alpha-trehalose-phosphate synthase [UDP-forming]
VSARKRLIVVSNRLPVTLEPVQNGFKLQPSCGGLVSALGPVLRDNAACWVGWTGTDYAPGISEFVAQNWHDSYSLVPVFLSAEEKACFYHGCSNEIIWPLFHDLQSRCTFDPAYWEAYVEVNEKFADAVEQVASKDDFVWVHDYHLMMLAAALRERELRMQLAYFHHIPFPPPDIFEKLPWRTEILRGLLQFNSLGFQTARDRRNFVACVRRCLRNVHIRRIGARLLVEAEGLCTTVGTLPISIDFGRLAGQALDANVGVRAEQIQRSLDGNRIILGVDRLDYTKGIPERLLAFRKLLEYYPDTHGHVTMVQVVVPSREEIPNYQQLKLSIEHLVSQINGEFGRPGWTPVLYLHRCLDLPELVAYYRAAHVALVTPLKDGMNLVAKEFCAARVDGGGVLVLSEFAGAASELNCGALMVNPYDVEGVSSALHWALHMNGREQRQRMQQMREVIQQHDVFRWCKAACAHAIRVRFGPALARDNVAVEAAQLPGLVGQPVPAAGVPLPLIANAG